jgi:tetratricopeptide (TPR) repeat protein
MPSTRKTIVGRWLILSVVVTSAVGAGAFAVGSRKESAFISRSTIGDLEVSHSRVLVGAVARQGTSRLAAGDRIVTELAGRAKLRLASGVRMLVDANSEVRLGDGQVALLRGRMFVDSPEGRRLDVALGSLRAPVSASKVAFERSADGAQSRIFCAQGEVMVADHSAPTRVPSGETLTAVGGKSSVEPEKAFDDWTGGLAVPWATKPLLRSTLADVWTTTEKGEPLTPLTISSQSVDVELKGEFAITRTRSRYYNGNDQNVSPSVRVALPQNAILTNVSHRLSTDSHGYAATLETCQKEMSDSVTIARLEWAGNGWLAGTLPTVPAGASIDLELEYGEWLTSQSGRFSYRYSMARGDDSPLIGELGIRVSAESSGASSIEANQAAMTEGKQLIWRAADTKPSDDWVVSFSPAIVRPRTARAYVEPDAEGRDPYVLVRAETEIRSTDGVELALVVDSSRSVGLSGLDLARQVVDALLLNLSESDQVVAFAADEDQRALGSATPTANTKAQRDAILSQLLQVRPGGASHLEKALERAADALDHTDEPSRNRVVVYLGDGRPTLGELTADQIRSHLQRRSNGIPRIAAVAIGTTADRWLLARLVAGSGPVYSVLDRSDAGTVAASIVSAAEAPTYRDVRLDLGPNVDRIHPREGFAVAAGSTTMVVGRLRGPLPQSARLSYRDGGALKTEDLYVERQGSPSKGELSRRWALARIDEIMSGKEGMEPALLLAQQHRLLLPWTEWVFDPSRQGQKGECSNFSKRVIELSALNDTPYANRIEAPPATGSGWLEPPLVYNPGHSLEEGARASAVAQIQRSKSAIITCRDARLPVAPLLPRFLDYRVALAADGGVERVTITPRDSGQRDGVFLSCVERVIRNVTFVGAEHPITFEGTVALPAPTETKRAACSIAAGLPLPLRRNIWSARTGGEVWRYEQALRSCEISTWIDRRELLLVLAARASATKLAKIAEGFLGQGYSDAAEFLRDVSLQRIASLDELKEFRQLALRSEPNLDADIAAKVRVATTDQERLRIVSRALAIAPHSPLGRRLQFLLLERLQNKDAILREVEAVRRDAFADAGLIALAAATLRRQGHPDEAERTFSELFERAPRDPWVLAFAGDQLRLEGSPEQAVSAYESLSRVVPNDTANLLRMGLAEAAIGRLDIATRLLERASQTAGRSDDQRLNELGTVLRAVVLGRAVVAATNPSDRLELGRRLAQTALPDVLAIVLVEAPASLEQGLAVRAYRGDDKTPVSPDLDATPLGLSALLVDRGTKAIKLEISRRTLAGLGRTLPVTISVLLLGDTPNDRQLRTLGAEIPTDQDKTLVTISAELRP